MGAVVLLCYSAKDISNFTNSHKRTLVDKQLEQKEYEKFAVFVVISSLDNVQDYIDYAKYTVELLGGNYEVWVGTIDVQAYTQSYNPLERVSSYA